MRPLAFRDYIRLRENISLPAKSLDQAAKDIKQQSLLQPVLAELFSEYMQCGGFPRAVIDFIKWKRVTTITERDILNWLRGDWMKAGKDEKYMKELLGVILRAKLTPLSWNNIARETSINSPHTVYSYVSTLERLFVIKVVELMGPDKKVYWRKAKKIHISDPLLYKVFSRYVHEKISEEVLAESIVAMHISRVAPIYYWHNGTEVDVIAEYNNSLYAYEIKWSFKRPTKNVPFKNLTILNKESIPVFLGILGNRNENIALDWTQISER